MIKTKLGSTAVSLFLLFAILMAGCAPAATAVPSTQTPVIQTKIVAGTPIVITATPGPTTPPPTQAPAFAGILAVKGFSQGDEVASERVKYTLQNLPGVSVNMTEGSLDMQQFLTSVASGNVPDLIYIDRSQVGTYAGVGAIQPLDDVCVKKQNIDLTQYYTAAINEDTLDGKLYGVPEFFNFETVLVSDNALADAGMKPTDLDLSNWDSIASMSKQVAKVGADKKVTRIGFDPKLPEFLPLWVAASGGTMLSADGKTATLNDPKVIEALKFTSGLIQSQGGFDEFMAFRNTWDFWGAKNEFVSNQVGAFPMEQWYANVLNTNSPDAKITFLPFVDKTKKPVTFATGSAWAIPVGSKNVDAACAFAKLMTSADSWKAAATARKANNDKAGNAFTGVYSGNKLADQIIFGQMMQPTGKPVWDNATKVLVAAQETAIAVPASPASAEFQQAWQDAVNRVLSGKQTVEAAMAQAQTEAQAALDKAWAKMK